MLSKRYESTEVDHRTWLHVPSGTQWYTSCDTQQVDEYTCKKKLLLIKMCTAFLIGMDNVRISGTDPSSVILSQTN